MSYDFNNAVKEWSQPPVDDVGYISSKEILKKSSQEVILFFQNFEKIRYSLQGWRNYENLWRKYLGLDCTSNKHILDFGCGFGIEAFQFKKNNNKVSIADISQDNLDVSEYIINTLGYNIEQKVLVSNEEPFFESQKFDIFYSNGVLHHTPKIKGILKRAHSLLNDNGEVRLMLYSDKAWTIHTNLPLPKINEDVTTSVGFDAYVKAMDSVGNYADWYNYEKIDIIIEDLYKIKDFQYICENGQYCVVILNKK